MELSVGNDTNSLWVEVQGHTNKADVVVGDYYRPPCQGNNTNELFYKELRDISVSCPVLMGVLSFQVLTGNAIQVIQIGPGNS